MLRRPVVLSAVLAFAEIGFILRFPQYTLYCLALCLIISAICIIISIKKKEFVIISVIVPTLLLSIVSAHLSYAKSQKPASEFLSSFENGRAAKFSAVVYECRNYPAYSQVFARIETADGKSLDSNLNARLGCYSGFKFTEGDRIYFEGTPTALSEIETDIFDTQSYLKSKNIHIDFPSISVISTEIAGKASLLSGFRSFTRSIIYKYVPSGYNYDTASVCYAVFAGDKNHIPKEIKNTFSECGLTHLLCVSGMHLAILAGTVYSLLALFTVHKRTRCSLTIILCILYTVFTGLSLSTVRACIMCCMGYMGMMSGRKTDGYISLFFSLLAICLISPYSVFDISLILSFCATFGILCFLELMPSYTGQSKFKSFIFSLLEAILANIGAVVFTLPICAVSFGGMSTMSVISTLSVSFIFELLLSFLLFLMLLSPLSFLERADTFLEICGRICNTLCEIIIKIANFYSHFRYASIETAFSGLFAVLFIICIAALSLFIAFEFPLLRRIFVFAIISLGIVFSVISLVFAAADDGLYKVTYYRKNENDRQLSIKLGKEGYLLVNADNTLCCDKDDAPFDAKYGKNLIFIIPDSQIRPYVLAQNILIFDNRFGIEKVFVPETEQGVLLALQLYEYGITCNYMQSTSEAGGIAVNYNADTEFYLSVDDGNVKTEVIFADAYNSAHFSKDADICAFFTRKTKNQFNVQNDTKPECGIFFTRLKKGENAAGVINTFGEKTVTIKG